MTEMEPTDAGAESSRPQAEKEPEGPAAGLWMRVTEKREAGVKDEGYGGVLGWLTEVGSSSAILLP